MQCKNHKPQAHQQHWRWQQGSQFVSGVPAAVESGKGRWCWGSSQQRAGPCGPLQSLRAAQQHRQLQHKKPCTVSSISLALVAPSASFTQGCHAGCRDKEPLGSLLAVRLHLC